MMTGLEARILLETGTSLKQHIQAMINNKESNRRLAEKLGITEKTVRNYAKRYGLTVNKKAYSGRVTKWGSFNYRKFSKSVALE